MVRTAACGLLIRLLDGKGEAYGPSVETVDKKSLQNRIARFGSTFWDAPIEDRYENPPQKFFRAGVGADCVRPSPEDSYLLASEGIRPAAHYMI